MKRRRGRCWQPCTYDKIPHSAHCLDSADGGVCIFPPRHKGDHRYGSPLLADRAGAFIDVPGAFDTLLCILQSREVPGPPQAGWDHPSTADLLFLADVWLDYAIRGVALPRGILIIRPIPENEREPGPDPAVALAYQTEPDPDDAAEHAAAEHRAHATRERRATVRRLDDRVIQGIIRRVWRVTEIVGALAKSAGDTITHSEAIEQIRAVLRDIPSSDDLDDEEGETLE